MWEYNQTIQPNELYHHGVLGMKRGKKKAESTIGNTEKISAYKSERKRQKKYLATKRTISVGKNIANNYFSRHQTTLNNKPVRVTPNAIAFIQRMLDYKYYKDTFK